MTDKSKMMKISYIFGELPPKPIHISGSILKRDIGFAAGKAVLSDHNLTLEMADAEFTIPFRSVMPIKSGVPVILYLGFDDYIPSSYLPAEEIIDRGYAIYLLNLNRIATPDERDKTTVARQIIPSRKKKSAAGCIMLWAWAALRMVEYISDSADVKNIIPTGHGLSAMSALLCASLDDKISSVIANDPFAPIGEGYPSLVCKTPRLFSPIYAEKPSECPIGALLSLCADKRVMLGSARDRSFADEDADRGAIADSGIIDFHYHSRGGLEYFSREDWNFYLDYLDEKLEK